MVFYSDFEKNGSLVEAELNSRPHLVGQVMAGQFFGAGALTPTQAIELAYGGDMNKRKVRRMLAESRKLRRPQVPAPARGGRVTSGTASNFDSVLKATGG